MEMLNNLFTVITLLLKILTQISGQNSENDYNIMTLENWTYKGENHIVKQVGDYYKTIRFIGTESGEKLAPDSIKSRVKLTVKEYLFTYLSILLEIKLHSSDCGIHLSISKDGEENTDAKLFDCPNFYTDIMDIEYSSTLQANTSICTFNIPARSKYFNNFTMIDKRTSLNFFSYSKVLSRINPLYQYLFTTYNSSYYNDELKILAFHSHIPMDEYYLVVLYGYGGDFDYFAASVFDGEKGMALNCTRHKADVFTIPWGDDFSLIVPQFHVSFSDKHHCIWLLPKKLVFLYSNLNYDYFLYKNATISAFHNQIENSESYAFDQLGRDGIDPNKFPVHGYFLPLVKHRNLSQEFCDLQKYDDSIIFSINYFIEKYFVRDSLDDNVGYDGIFSYPKNCRVANCFAACLFIYRIDFDNLLVFNEARIKIATHVSMSKRSVMIKKSLPDGNFVAKQKFSCYLDDNPPDNMKILNAYLYKHEHLAKFSYCEFKINRFTQSFNPSSLKYDKWVVTTDAFDEEDENRLAYTLPTYRFSGLKTPQSIEFKTDSIEGMIRSILINENTYTPMLIVLIMYTNLDALQKEDRIILEMSEPNSFYNEYSFKFYCSSKGPATNIFGVKKFLLSSLIDGLACIYVAKIADASITNFKSRLFINEIEQININFPYDHLECITTNIPNWIRNLLLQFELLDDKIFFSISDRQLSPVSMKDKEISYYLPNFFIGQRCNYPPDFCDISVKIEPYSPYFKARAMKVTMVFNSLRITHRILIELIHENSQAKLICSKKHVYEVEKAPTNVETSFYAIYSNFTQNNEVYYRCEYIIGTKSKFWEKFSTKNFSPYLKPIHVYIPANNQYIGLLPLYRHGYAKVDKYIENEEFFFTVHAIGDETLYNLCDLIIIQTHLEYKILSKHLPIITPNFSITQPSSIALTWIGHSTLLVRYPHVNILTDPIFSNTFFPLPFISKRYRPPPCEISDLPDIHVVLISHNHYDHLDFSTITKLGSVLFLIPSGLGNWFKSALKKAQIIYSQSSNEQNNVCEDKSLFNLTHPIVIEHDWWQESNIFNTKFIFTPSQHWSRRSLTDECSSLWGSWIVIGPSDGSSKGKFFFTGDSGYCDVFKQIGNYFGPFDLAAIPIGAYSPRWFFKPRHVDPFEAVEIHKDLNAKNSVAIHWGTFSLGQEFYLEPPEKLKEALIDQNIELDRFITLKHGDTKFFRY